MRKQHLTLSAADRQTLESLLKKGSLKAREFKRATGLLELDRGRTFTQIGQTLGVSDQTVSRWCTSYKAEGLKLLKDQPRPGRPPELAGLPRAKITALACSEPPEGRARWTLRLLADKAVELGYCEEISHTHVGEILKKTNSNRTKRKRGVSGR